ncbi:MAG: murein biosynthesis integral membrane protein MurJ [Anaerolineae bacterium]|nr:murein biosynthesis integral membrane protein MurJ [Anaerolineae bacterium]MDW8299098.1 murein biosynthesis integral membrane protein MurJ [Anaerolineae bacterium]
MSEPIPSAPAVPIEDEHAPEAVATGLARATTILAIGNVASRVLGFAKEILLSNLFGASRAVDAFQIAITIPRDLYDLAIFGHTNSAIVPVLSEYAAQDDKRELWRLVSALLSLVLLVSGILALCLTLFAPQVISFYRGAPALTLLESPFVLQPALLRNSGMSMSAFTLSAELLRLTAPSLLFMSAFSVLAGMLYALRRFTYPAFGAALFNLMIVLGTLALAPRIGIQGVAIGWILGAVAQMSLQFLGMRGVPLRLMLWSLPRMLRHRGLRRIGVLYLPVLFTLVIDVLINRPFSYTIASQTGEGNIAYMHWATNLREFPMGLVGTAISIAILPTLARQALDLGQRAAFRQTLGQGIRLALTLIIPAAIGMFVLAGPLIGLLFEHGQFTAQDTFNMAVVLRLYLLGIPFAAIDLLLINAFYAQRDSLTPALVGLFSLGCYIAITLLLLPYLGFLSLMVADSAKHFIHMSVSFMLLRRRLNGLGSQRLVSTALKVSGAAAVMGVLAYVTARAIFELFPPQGLQERLLLVFVPSAAGVVFYFFVAARLQLNEFTLFVRALTRRLRRT